MIRLKKVTILALHLGYGGIEKCISMLANALCETNQVEIISTYQLYEKPAFSLNSAIKVQYLLTEKPNREEFLSALKHFQILKVYQEGKKAITILKKKRKKMIEAIQNCNSDVIISTRDLHNKWLGKYGKRNIFKIGWEHNHPHGNKKYAKKVIQSVQNLDAFVVVSKSLHAFYKPRVKCPCIYIPNAIASIPKEQSKQTEKRIISVGRLSFEKGFRDLIDVFARIHEKQPDWQLEIIGDGIEKSNLERQIQHYNLEKYITLHGYQKKEYIDALLHQSSVYVMTSYTESFGIVLLEAFSHGLPCVAFSRAEGACELIDNNWDGYLVSSQEQMVKRILELINNQNRRIIMGNNGYKKVQKYQMEEIKKEWISLLERDTYEKDTMDF